MDDIRNTLKQLLPHLEKRYGVVRLWVFGSRVRGEQHSSSDVDVLVEFGRRELSLFDFAGLELEIEDRLGVKVDLVERDALRKEIRSGVLMEAVAI